MLYPINLSVACLGGLLSEFTYHVILTHEPPWQSGYGIMNITPGVGWNVTSNIIGSYF
jgi:hypothetical protein